MGKQSRRDRPRGARQGSAALAQTLLGEQLPPVSEGRHPSAEELEAKLANGRFYQEDIWKIEREFPSRDNYETPTDLLGLVGKMRDAVAEAGYEMVDSSARLDGITHALHLAEAWASVCRDARTSNRLHLIRRTPSNCGAALMVQRLEHLRGQCTELAPLAYVAICRDDQHVVTRDQVAAQAVTERLILSLAENRDDCCLCLGFLRSRQATSLRCGHMVHTDCFQQLWAADRPRCPLCRADLRQMQPNDEPRVICVDEGSKLMQVRRLDAALTGQRRDRPPNMPAALYRQQMNHISTMMTAMGVAPAFSPPPPPPPEVELGLRVDNGVVLAALEVV
jgi:hypothetical protein